ncbi:hypothetical protein B9Q04_12515 [Candidatus Marsarchaeota G2 archaeon BE_D]|jgi:hypothetical protein|uniref:Zinc-ribbon domain-containing protein n=2 Tax=Candidatus Marsarchaeota group 2 TaxID=2203771 RepID=A0A2R6C8A7_9ARCH|nr:MAG: hypothetical protein B9Q04_12515 [Candidatus Marsarchaeota G2 archaeon BE_D]
MRKCSLCGAKNPDSAISCTNCGAPLYIQQQEETYTPPNQSVTPTEAQSPAQVGAQSANTPVAVVDFKRGLPIMGILSTLVFIIIVAVSSLSSGGLSYPLLAFVFILVAATLINVVGRNRSGLARIRYEFYPDSMKVEYGRGSTSIPYTEFEDIRLRGSRIIVDLKPGSQMRRIVVPQNPPVSGGSTTLYEWLSFKVNVEEENSGEDSAGQAESSPAVNPGAPPAP